MIFIYFNEVIMKEYIAKEYKYTQSKCKKFPATTYYTVFFITAGKCTCRSREKTYFCATEEIILVNPGTSVEIEYPASKTPLHFLQISFSAELLKRLSDEQTDLESCFHVVPYQVVVIQAESEISMLIKNLSKRLLTLPKETTDFGHALFQDSILSMLIVLLLRACIHVEFHTKSKTRSRLALDDIFIFIKHHLYEEISLERLEKEFFISKYHISREFKRQTGITVHQYIVKAKLDLCKRLLEKGYPMTEIYQICGLGNYNNLFRAFKREFGITPGEYVRQVQERQKTKSDVH